MSPNDPPPARVSRRVVRARSATRQPRSGRCRPAQPPRTNLAPQPVAARNPDVQSHVWRPRLARWARWGSKLGGHQPGRAAATPSADAALPGAHHPMPCTARLLCCCRPGFGLLAVLAELGPLVPGRAAASLSLSGSTRAAFEVAAAFVAGLAGGSKPGTAPDLPRVSSTNLPSPATPAPAKTTACSLCRPQRLRRRRHRAYATYARTGAMHACTACARMRAAPSPTRRLHTSLILSPRLSCPACTTARRPAAPTRLPRCPAASAGPR